jgi:hypothetical protein
MPISFIIPPFIIPPTQIGVIMDVGGGQELVLNPEEASPGEIVFIAMLLPSSSTQLPPSSAQLPPRSSAG